MRNIHGFIDPCAGRSFRGHDGLRRREISAVRSCHIAAVPAIGNIAVGRATACETGRAPLIGRPLGSAVVRLRVRLVVAFGTMRRRFAQALGIPTLVIGHNPVAVVLVAFRVDPVLVLTRSKGAEYQEQQ